MIRSIRYITKSLVFVARNSYSVWLNSLGDIYLSGGSCWQTTWVNGMKKNGHQSFITDSIQKVFVAITHGSFSHDLIANRFLCVSFSVKISLNDIHLFWLF